MPEAVKCPSIVKCESFLSGIKLPINRVIISIKIIITFTIVCFGWIFFRANTLNDAIYIIKDMSELSNYHYSQLSLYVIPVAKNTVFAMDIFLSVFFVRRR